MKRRNGKCYPSFRTALILALALCVSLILPQAGMEARAGEPAVPSVSGALRVSGTRLVDQNGRGVQLKGISTHGIAWYPDYINEAAFGQFRSQWNANVIRLAMYTAEYNGYCTGGDQTYLKDLVRRGIRYATARDLYVIVDWHILSDGNPNTYKEEAKSFFREISKEFASSNNVLYEICNEPNGGTGWKEIKAYAEEVIPVIRANDPDAVIIVGTPNWSQYVDQAVADPITGYDNIMYALHFYAATHKDDLRNRLAGAVAAGLPVFVTEYGICDASGNGAIDKGQAEQWVKLLDQNGISYVAWNLSNKGETSAILQSSCTKTSGFSDSDLSESGKWLKDMLGGSLAGNSSGTGQGAGTTGQAAGPGNQGAGANGQGAGTNGQAAGPGSQTAGQSSQSTGSGSQAAGQGAGATGWAAGPGSPNAGSGGQTAGQSGQSTGQAAGPGSQNTGSGSQAAGQSSQSTGSSGQSLGQTGLQITPTLVNSWNSGGEPYYHYTLTLTNTSSAACDHWTVQLPFDGSFRLTDCWNGDYTVSGTTLTISSKSYNGAIPAGGSVSDVGFIVAGRAYRHTGNTGGPGTESGTR